MTPQASRLSWGPAPAGHHRAWRLVRVLAAVALCAAAARSAFGSAGPRWRAGAVAARQPAPAARLLDVPYLPQSEDLCGGAAAAMVMRYWGARGVYAEAFAALVDHRAGGIRTDVLVSTLKARSWTTLVEDGRAARVREHLDRGRPVIALIEDRPGRYHYVVVVAWAAGHVVLHDPARAPLRTMTDDAFDRAWQKSGRWMLVLLPPADLKTTAAAPAAALPAPAAPASCAALVDEGVARANSGDRVRAAEILRRAITACPGSSAPWREIAGLDVLAENWTAAAAHAQDAVSRDVGDQYAWNLLGTALFVTHDDAGALRAWNHARLPVVDLLNVQGLARTRYRVVFDTAAFAPGTLLTPERLRLSERRLRDVPAFSAARVSFRPSDDGRAQIDAAIVERDFVPRGYPALIGLGVDAAAERTVAASISSPTGGGDLLTASWRWWRHRPAVAMSFAAPAPAMLGGVWRVEAARESESFGTAAVEETRTRAGLTLGKWMTARLRLEAGAGIDSWSAEPTQYVPTQYVPTENTDYAEYVPTENTDHAEYLDQRRTVPGPRNPRDPWARDPWGSGSWRVATLGGQVQFWPIADRLVIDAGAAAWRGSGTLFSSGSVRGRWWSTRDNSGQVWLARAGAQIASDAAPASLWPGADTGHARDVLLRAHPLLHDGVITGGVFGRRLLFGGAEWRRWSRPSKWLMQVAPAAFVDVARARRGLDTSDMRTQVDAGAGLRMSLAGLGVLRVDVARGLRDGRTALSVAVER